MFNFKALFITSLLAVMVNTVWAQERGEAVLYGSYNCTGSDHSDTIGMSTGVCHSTSFTSGSITQTANSVQFDTDGVDELYYYYIQDGCQGSPGQTDYASVCVQGLAGYASFKKAA